MLINYQCMRSKSGFDIIVMNMECMECAPVQTHATWDPCSAMTLKVWRACRIRLGSNGRNTWQVALLGSKCLINVH